MSVATLQRPANTARSADQLMSAGRVALAEACAANDAAERYAAAHLAALRAAAALLADRARPTIKPVRSRRPASAWTLLAGIAPELAEWAAYFASGADKRAAAQAGMRSAVTTREADDLLRDAGAFVALVENSLGMLPIELAQSELSHAIR
jgi:hypothetical protein